MDGDRLQLAGLWQRSLKDARLRRSLVGSLLRTLADNGPDRLAAHVGGLEIVLQASRAQVSDDFLVSYREYLAAVGDIVASIAAALPQDSPFNVAFSQHFKRHALPVAAESTFLDETSVPLLVRALPLDLDLKIDVLVDLLPLTDDYGLRTKDIFDTGGGASLLREAREEPDTPAAVLLRLILDRPLQTRRRLMSRLADRRRLMRNDVAGNGEVAVGELIASLLLITSTDNPKDFIRQLLEAPGIDQAETLLAKLAAMHPLVALQCALDFLDGPSRASAMRNVLAPSLGRAGPGRVPMAIFQRLQDVMRTASADARIDAAILMRLVDPDDVEAWDILDFDVSAHRSTRSLLPVPAARFDAYLRTLRVRADDYAIGSMKYCDDDPALQQPMAALAIEWLDGHPRYLASEFGDLGEHKAYLVDRHPAFECWIDFIVLLARQLNWSYKSGLRYLFGPQAAPPSDQRTPCVAGRPRLDGRRGSDRSIGGERVA